jgi:hypothetical protein
MNLPAWGADYAVTESRSDCKYAGSGRPTCACERGHQGPTEPKTVGLFAKRQAEWAWTL